MVSFFRRKKPESGPGNAPRTDSTQRYSLEELAAAFPDMQDRGVAVPDPANGVEVQPAAGGESASAESLGVPATASQPPSIPITDALPSSPSTGWRERLRGTGFALGLGGLFSRNPKLDDALLDEVETALLMADVGVPATTALVEALRKRMKAREFTNADALLKALRAELVAALAPVAQPLVIDIMARPFVILTVGVNGVGKTTTIGKLARRFKD